MVQWFEWLSGREPTCQRVGKIPREGNGTPRQYSSLGNPMDRGASWAIVYGVTKESDPT